LTSFLLDGMLGSLAKWLRLAGFDAVYYRAKDDDELIQEAVDSQRLLLSRDKSLIQSAKKMGVDAILVNRGKAREQLVQIKEYLGVGFLPSLSRCPVCNGELFQKTKEEVQEKVPESSLNAFNEFWMCKSCEKVYWKGSHWENIIETIEAP
jgi:uncharacterized protein with PIN domain